MWIGVMFVRKVSGSCGSMKSIAPIKKHILIHQAYRKILYNRLRV